jgi:copper chaperone CopZ
MCTTLPYAHAEVSKHPADHPHRTIRTQEKSLMSTTTTATTETATVGRRFDVVGMTCSHCERAIEAEVAAIDGVCSVTADAASGTVLIESSKVLDVAAVAAAVDEAGYELVR